MIAKTISYTDYDDNERTETFYFHLSKAELTEMELSTEGGLEKAIKKIISEQKIEELVKIFKGLILKSYGEKSPDGRRFVKSEELTAEFTQTEAYSVLFMELATDDVAAIEFIEGLMPKGLEASVRGVEVTKPQQRPIEKQVEEEI